MAVDIVSHWTWASILLTSVSYGYFYGITGSYWYVCVLMYSVHMPLLSATCMFATFTLCLTTQLNHFWKALD